MQIRSFSRCILWAMSLLVLSACAVRANSVVTGADVKQAVVARLKSENISADPQISLNRRYYACKGDLSVEPKYQNSWETVNVSCPDASGGWVIMIRTGQVMARTPQSNNQEPEQETKIVALLASVKKGEVLTQDIVKLIEMPNSQRVGSFFRLEDVVGRRTTQSLSAMQPLRARHLEHHWAVQEGELLQIVQKIGGLEVSSLGKALEDGQIGDQIRIQNAKSGNIISVLVETSKKVSPIANIN